MKIESKAQKSVIYPEKSKLAVDGLRKIHKEFIKNNMLMLKMTALEERNIMYLLKKLSRLH